MAHARRRADGGGLMVVEPYFIPDSWLAWGIFLSMAVGGARECRAIFLRTRKYFFVTKNGHGGDAFCQWPTLRAGS